MDFTWASDQIGAPAALALAARGSGRPVAAILDNDCASRAELRDHPEQLWLCAQVDLRCALVPGGVRSGSHGLACAALVGGHRTGVAPGIPLYIGGIAARAPLQAAFLRWGSGISEDRAHSSGLPRHSPRADLISVSLTLEDDPVLVSALGDCREHGRGGRGTVVVIAACNFGQESAPRIARHGLCITIGASCIDEDGNEEIAPYSNWGRGVDLYAPSGSRLGRGHSRAYDKVLAAALPFEGTNIWQEDELERPPRGSVPEPLRPFYSLTSGTSTATALCAGTVALMLRANPELTSEEVKWILRTTARQLRSRVKGDFLRLDAAAAVSLALEYRRPLGWKGSVGETAALKNLA